MRCVIVDHQVVEAVVTMAVAVTLVETVRTMMSCMNGYTMAHLVLLKRKLLHNNNRLVYAAISSTITLITAI
jgi:hypothetical protein